MALILLGETECSLCGVVIKEGDDIVATTHFIADRNDPLWQFSDSAMHKSCFLAWDQRYDFVKKYNDARGTIHHMEDDGYISVLKKRNGTQ